MKKLFSISVLFIATVMIVVYPKSLLAAFKDVPKTHFAIDAINYVESKNIVKGYEDATFRPDIPVNRAEFTTIIVRALFEYQKEKNCFQDVKEEWFSEFI